MSRNNPVDGNYDIDLWNSGDGWQGTFGLVVRTAILDITDEGPWSPAEVTVEGGTVYAGTLQRASDHFEVLLEVAGIGPVQFPVSDVVRFRA